MPVSNQNTVDASGFRCSDQFVERKSTSGARIRVKIDEHNL
jgi:hypothetical protein